MTDEIGSEGTGEHTVEDESSQQEDEKEGFERNPPYKTPVGGEEDERKERRERILSSPRREYHEDSGGSGGEGSAETSDKITKQRDIRYNYVHRFLTRLAGFLNKRDVNRMYVEGYYFDTDDTLGTTPMDVYIGARCIPEVLSGIEVAWRHILHLRRVHSSRVFPGLKNEYDAIADDGKCGALFAQLVAVKITESGSAVSEVVTTKRAMEQFSMRSFALSREIRNTSNASFSSRD